MEIRLNITNSSGQEFKIIYNDLDDISDAEGKNVIGVYAYCFYKDQLVIVNEKGGYRGNPGGGLEKGEGIIAGIHREVREEANMKITKLKPIGIHETVRPSGESVHYVRFACLVEPLGDFEKDPDGDVGEIKLIDPSEFIELCDSQWGKMAERMLERAIKTKKQMEAEI